MHCLWYVDIALVGTLFFFLSLGVFWWMAILTGTAVLPHTLRSAGLLSRRLQGASDCLTLISNDRGLVLANERLASSASAILPRSPPPVAFPLPTRAVIFISLGLATVTGLALSYCS